MIKRARRYVNDHEVEYVYLTSHNDDIASALEMLDADSWEQLDNWRIAFFNERNEVVWTMFLNSYLVKDYNEGDDKNSFIEVEEHIHFNASYEPISDLVSMPPELPVEVQDALRKVIYKNTVLDGPLTIREVRNELGNFITAALDAELEYENPTYVMVKADISIHMDGRVHSFKVNQ